VPKRRSRPATGFYALYDKVYRRDVLSHAYERCRRNAGAPGVDGQTFDDIEAYGRERWLDERVQELREKRRIGRTRFKRVWIPKGDGKQRPSGGSDDSRPRGADGGGPGHRADL